MLLLRQVNSMEKIKYMLLLLLFIPIIALAKVYIDYKFDINFESEQNEEEKPKIIKALKIKKKDKKPEETIMKAEDNTVNKEE